MATMEDSAVTLDCEMSAFIRPDNSLMWTGPSGQNIAGGTGKFQITFSDGSPDAAVDGSDVLVPSRVSTLTITNPEPSDSGTYTCSVIDTSEAVTIELMVNGSSRLTTTRPLTTTSKFQKSTSCSVCNGMPCFAMENSVSQPTKLHKFCISIAVTYKVYRNNYSNINSR